MSETPNFTALYQGPSNRFAQAALTAVAHSPGNCYNPLWLYGPSGTGKTAMLNAVAASLKDHPSRPLILHIHTEQLLHDMIRAIQRGQYEAFRERILGFRVIVLDHADCLMDKSFTQQQIGRLLATAARQGSQVILASACKPKQMDSLAQTLADSCVWFLCCDVSAPDPAERLTIARQLARARKLPLSEQMVCRIISATRTPAQIRCIIDHLAARRKLLHSDDTALSEALDHLLEKEVAV